MIVPLAVRAIVVVRFPPVLAVIPFTPAGLVSDCFLVRSIVVGCKLGMQHLQLLYARRKLLLHRTKGVIDR